jgi:hypothetical protein
MLKMMQGDVAFFTASTVTSNLFHLWDSYTGEARV